MNVSSGVSPAGSVAPAKTSYFHIDCLRALAAFVVVLIHVIGPLRDHYPLHMDTWFSAIIINGSTRWCIPIFMMISGALLLGQTRPFDCSVYLRKRLLKVGLPFVAWSLIYGVLAWCLGRSEGETLWQHLQGLNNDPAWYHLWFFYDFIPLYFVLPFLAALFQRLGWAFVQLTVAAWLLLVACHTFQVESVFRENILLYSGMMVFGYWINVTEREKGFSHLSTPLLLMVAVGLCVLNVLGTWYASVEKEAYSSLFMGYKTLNTVIIAGAVFIVVQRTAHRVPEKFVGLIKTLAMYSLGIYVMHPLLLIVVRDESLGLYEWFGFPLIAIVVWGAMAFLGAAVMTSVLVKTRFTKWLVP